MAPTVPSSAEAPELAGNRALGSGIGGVGIQIKRQMGHIVGDADGKLSLGAGRCHVIVNSENVGRRGILGSQTVTAACNLRLYALSGACGDDVLIQRFAQAAGFLGAVQNGNVLDCLGKRGAELFSRERAIQADLQQADLFPRGPSCSRRPLQSYRTRSPLQR